MALVRTRWEGSSRPPRPAIFILPETVGTFTPATAVAEGNEFKMFQTRDANGTPVPAESKAEPFESVEGVVRVPTGPGLGVNIDPDYIKTHPLVTA